MCGPWERLPKTYNPFVNYVILSAFFIAFTLPMVFNRTIDTFEASDERVFHYPTIITFADEFPNTDLADYNSATTPLFHLTMMVFQRFFGFEITLLRIVNVLISLLCILLINAAVATNGNLLKALIFSFVFMLSPYWLGTAVRLNTDNMALLFIIAAFLILDRVSFTQKQVVIASALLAAATLTRQLGVTMVGVGIIAIHLNMEGDWQKKILNSLWMLLPVLVLIPFVLLWRGLTPPTFQDRHTLQGMFSPMSLFYGLAVFASYSVFFGFYLVRFFQQAMGSLWHLGIVIAATLVLLVIFPIARTDVDRRVGGILWRVAEYFPRILDTSLLFWLLVPLGAVALYALGLYASKNRRWLLVLAFLAWFVSLLASDRIYQKYYEPFCLFVLINSVKEVDNEPAVFWLLPAILIPIYLMIDTARYLI